ncbi:MAG: hypothetical protein HC893_05130 [Chloroflexaceae bacterium]|nr:hypothetical protein [Chloroflexaceae bacterium]
MTVAEDATRTATTEAPMLLPILPITDAVLFPNMLMPLIIKNETWIKLIDDAALANKMLAVFWRPEVIEPFDPQTISPIGATAQIVRMMRLQDGRMQVLLQGQSRASIQEFVATEPYPTAMVLPVEDEVDANSLEVEALSRNTLAAFQSVIQISATCPMNWR